MAEKNSMDNIRRLFLLICLKKCNGNYLCGNWQYVLKHINITFYCPGCFIAIAADIYLLKQPKVVITLITVALILIAKHESELTK